MFCCRRPQDSWVATVFRSRGESLIGPHVCVCEMGGGGGEEEREGVCALTCERALSSAALDVTGLQETSV